LGLARDLCPKQYAAIAKHIVMDEQVVETVNTTKGFQQMIASARSHHDEWTTLVDAVHAKAAAVSSDIDGIWISLEKGRMEWLRSVNAAHELKHQLKEALKSDNAQSSAGDVSDAMMVWIYALCININGLRPFADKWARKVGMLDRWNPLQGYRAGKWDPRMEEWRPLDLGAQEAAERGGTTLQDAWEA
jgi:hypothetical protein